MIAAAAMLLVGLSAAQADTPVLRAAVEPKWAVSTKAPPIALTYQREPGQMIASTARADFRLAPESTVFMQARTLKQETQWDSPKRLGKTSSRAVSVGLTLHW